MKRKLLAVELVLFYFLLFAGFAHAQKVRTMTGTVERPIMENHWSGFVMRVGNQEYAVQTDQWYGLAAPGKGYRARRIGKKADSARKVIVYYSEIDCSSSYPEYANCFVRAIRFGPAK